MADERILKALVELRIASCNLQAAVINLDASIRDLMAKEVEIKKDVPKADEAPEPPV